MMKITTVAFYAVALAGCATTPERTLDEVLIAHRGESHDAPENTLPAYKTAVERGFGFECDIYLSTDGRLFTFHDDNLKRTTAGANSNSCTAASWEKEISGVNVGGWGKWKGSKFDPTRPALLEEVLALARPGRKIYVEVKGGDGAVNWVKTIKETFARCPEATPETALFISFSAKTCAELKRLMPEYKCYFLDSPHKDSKWKKPYGPPLPASYYIGLAEKYGFDGVDLQYFPECITAEFVRELKAAGLSVHVWTVDDPAVAAEALGRRVDTITTNRAKFLREELVGRYAGVL